jgi:hypothetical protein
MVASRKAICALGSEAAIRRESLVDVQANRKPDRLVCVFTPVAKSPEPKCHKSNVEDPAAATAAH